MSQRLKLLALFAFLLPALWGSGQSTALLKGKVTDQDGRPLELVNVAIVGTSFGTTTNSSGQYALSIPADSIWVIDYSFIGYQRQRFQVTLNSGSNREFNVALEISTTELQGVEVRDEQVRYTNYIRLDPKEAKMVPSITGGIEALIKTLPGVSSSNELSSQYSVRGGNYDENLVYVNGIEIYRPFLIRSGQQEGLSFINPDLVSNITFSAGGFEAKYGDKLSSVLDIQYKQPVEFAGSAEVSLLGASTHVEGASSDRRFTYLAGARYKTNQYILKGLETKGDYKPNFIDVQGLLSYDLTEKLEISVLGYYSRNSYNLIPESRQTNFGTLTEAYRLQIYFDGQELDRYSMYLGAVTADYDYSKDINLKLIASAFQSLESETYDVRGQYWIGKLEMAEDSEEYGNVTEVQGVGTNMIHARNYLDANVISLEHKGSWKKGANFFQWGTRYQHEMIDDRFSEWEVIDSAGFSIPQPPNNIGGQSSGDPFEISSSVKSSANMTSNRLNGFLQDTWNILHNEQVLAISAGIRFQYWDYNGQATVSPRVTLSYRPAWKRDLVIRFSTGFYHQPPFYKELRDMEGVLHPEVRAQESIHFVAGADYGFTAWGRPFKFVAEAYYKYLNHLIPYIVDNVRIRYLAGETSKGYAYGLDMRVNGEFIKGIESWASLSIMKTAEDIEGDYYYDYYNEEGVKIIPGYTPDQVAVDSVYHEPGYIPRPTDQRVNFSLFFQDYLPSNPTYGMSLTLIFGTGLPFGAPDSPKYTHTNRMPPYRRVDIGFSKQLITEKTKFKDKNPLKVFTSAWINLEVLNLFGTNNTVSYNWVTDVNNRQYAVPNYLTPRQLNLKLLVEF
jgi:hypothetical protein